MKRILLAAGLIGASLWAGAQVSPIPWRPKASPAPAKKAAEKGQAGAKPGEPAKYTMTFDKMTTLSPGVYVAEGNVRFESEGMLLTADSVTYDSDKGTLWATGQVAVDWKDFTATGSELNYDMKAGTGVLKDAYGVQQDGEFTVAGREIQKTGEDWYTLVDGTFTSCTAAVPPWSMSMTRGRFHVDNYAFLTNPTFKARTAPLLWLPYLVWPIKPDRSTGLLIPEIGSSTSKGFTVNNALFIAPADWWDDTVYLDGYSELGWGVGEELRYAPSTDTYGWFHGYYIKQKTDDQKRWNFVWTHLQTLPKGWFFLADVNLLSDINFPRDFNRDYAQSTVSGTDSRIFLTRNWGPYSFNVKAERRLQYYTEDRDLQQKALPGVEFRSNLQRISGDLYGGFETSADYLHKEWASYDLSGAVKHALSYERLDAHPFIELPWHPTLWLDVTPRLEVRATYYGETVGDKPEDPNGPGLWRTYAKASLEAAGPRFYRKFHNGYKHVIEPFAVYSYISPDLAAARIPVYDQVDQVPLDVNQIRYGVRSRLYRKNGDLTMDAELYQSRSFATPLSGLGKQASQFSPAVFLLRLWPSTSWSADLRLRYSILAHTVDSQSLSFSYSPHKREDDDFVRLTYLKTKAVGISRDPEDIYVPNPAVTTNPAASELRLTANMSLADHRVQITPYVERDLEQNTWRDLRVIFWYRGSCYAVGFEAGRRIIGDYQDTSYRFLISLKGAGTVVDLNSGTGIYPP